MSNQNAQIRVVATKAPTSGSVPDTVSGWESVREVFVHDSPMHDRTFKWLATLPSEIRPMATARRYPRIVNRIADLWSHCEYTRLNLQSLLHDRRGGRLGFPGPIRKELEALQQHYFENLSGLPAVLWNAVPLAEPRVPKKVFAPLPRNTEIQILPLYET
jgi:hypothetical protein